MAKQFGIAAVTVSVLSLSVPVFAHHGAASFDTAHMKVVAGTVTQYIWSNPHVIVMIDSKAENGELQHWVIEGWNPITQTAYGWTKDSFKAGDDVSIMVTPAKNGRPVGEVSRPGRIVINGKEFKQQER